jgi:predicted AlkP superfamily pyrophosphatase or phosphodiesterase
MKFLNIFLISFAIFYLTDNQRVIAQIERPKLIVGIVVDQMRVDYLYRYYEKFGEGGFKRLLKQGFHCRNAHYNYVPTETGPGHASIYTGTTPAMHGIVANNWYENYKPMYCAADSTVQTLGSKTGSGQMSPRNMFATTISDQLKLATNQKSKVIGISLKDRGAIFPAGHSANAAYWYDQTSGKFISSNYYFNSLPAWVEKFNEKKLADKYLKETWNTLLPIDKYTESSADDNAYEQLLPGKTKPIFPYNLKEMSDLMTKGQMKRSPYELIPLTPYGNTIVKEMALAALVEEKLGQGNVPDLLAISFSSTDIIGHSFGINSIEVEDTYLRLDKNLEELFEMLDRSVGEDNYLVFLSADHAGANNPKYSQDQKLPGGFVNIRGCAQSLETYLNTLYGQDFWVSHTDSKEIYLNRKLLIQKKVDIEEMQKDIINYLRGCEGIFDAYAASDLEEEDYSQGIKEMVQNGYYHQRSPDVTIIYKPGYLENYWNKGGTSHGSPYNYDTQVPILWYGWKIPKGKSTIRRVQITDIAPTLAMLLNIQIPSSSNGEVIKELFE